MCRFIETLRIEGGEIYNGEEHERRMNRTRRQFFPESEPLRLKNFLTPDTLLNRTRCRIEYDRDIQHVEYIPYRLRPVNCLKLVEEDDLEYEYKYADRSALNRLFALRGETDDVLIIRNGLVTDTTICNVAFGNGQQWFTPSVPLLCGTMREKLLQEGLIKTKEIPFATLRHFQKIRLFNAMIDFGEVELPVSAIVD